MKTQPSLDLNEILAFVGRFSHLLGNALESVMTLVVLVERGAVPWWAWPALLAAIGYLLNPLDALPDPVFLDDAGVLAGVVGLLQFAVTDEIRAEARRRAQSLLGQR